MAISPQQSCDGLASHAAFLGLRDAAMSSGLLWLKGEASIPAGADRAGVQLRFRRISVCVAHATVDSPFIETTCDILLSGDVIGVYRYITDIDGKPDDDYWEIFKEMGQPVDTGNAGKASLPAAEPDARRS